MRPPPHSNLSGGPKLLNLKSETEESAVGAAEYLNCDVLQTISNWELEWDGRVEEGRGGGKMNFHKVLLTSGTRAKICSELSEPF